MKSVPSFISVNDSIITEKRPNFKKRLIEELKKWSILSTAHGILPAVNPTTRIFRIIWLLCLACSLAVCTYMIYRVIAQYLNWELVVKIEEKDVDELVFPTITLCNINPFVTPEAFVYLRDYYNTNYKVNITNFSEFAKLVQNKTIPYETDWIFYQTFDPNFNQTLKRSFGYSAEQRIRNCQINTKACKPSDFVWYYSPIYGNCYIFNSGYDSSGKKTEVYKIDREGSGLSMQVFISLDDTKFPYMYQAKSKGLVIIVDDQDNLPIKRLGLFNPNDFAKVSISKKVTRSLPAPYSACQYSNSINSILLPELKRLKFPYSRTNCMTLCEQKQIIDSLGCYDMRLPQIFNAKPCRSKAEYYKINNFLFDYQKCYSLCPYECETVKFETSTSYAQYPTYNYYVNETLRNKKYYTELYKDDNISYGEFIKGVGKVFVFYEALKYTEISSDPKWEVVDLIANIGGTLGLFLGVSLLSFVEFIELGYQMFKAYRSEYKKDLEVRREIREIQRN